MGMDFVALMGYGGPAERLHRALDRLEIASPEEVRAVARLMHARGHAIDQEGSAGWEYTSRPELRDPRLDRRPALPRSGVALCLPEGFDLTFGPDAVEVYLRLRWLLFLTDPFLRRAVLGACVCLGRLLGATRCVVTSDYSPVVRAFRSGRSFEHALASAGSEDGERPALSDLCTESPADSVMRFIDRPGQPSRARHMDWPADRPPPEGWLRETTWESKGYWRLELGPGLPGEAGLEPLAPSPARPRTRDENWWAECGEPDAMLDFLLKRDDADWKKVLLWACACVRHIWPLLATEGIRRAVEVVERFACGLASEREVEAAGRAAGGVKKGNRRANHAAWLLTRLASSAWRFPPGDISEAVVEAVAGSEELPSARAEERAAHADQARCVFGSPFRPVVFDQSWRLWNGGAAVALARAVYAERDFSMVPLLADMVEDAGATDAQLLEHLRGPGPHARGCFAVDGVLGRGG